MFDFGDTHLIFEVRGLKTDGYLGQKVGNIAHLEEGVIAGGKFFPKGKKEGEPLPKAGRDSRRGPGGGHFGNFIAAVRSRKVEDLNADILEGHYSSALCHLANISYRLGAPAPFDKKAQAFGADKAAAETFARMEEHLKENGVPLDGHSYQLGRALTFDARSESFVDAPEADKLLTRAYRKPFVVPGKIG